MPPDLTDLVDRVGGSGSITGTASGASTSQTTPTIAPPNDPDAMVAAPEPSMPTVASMFLASLPIVRRPRRGPRT